MDCASNQGRTCYASLLSPLRGAGTQSQTATQGRVGIAFCLCLTSGPTGTVACNPLLWDGWPHPCLDPRDPSSTSPHVSTTQNVSRYCPMFSGTGEGLGAGAGNHPLRTGVSWLQRPRFQLQGAGLQPLPLWLPVHMAPRRRHFCPRAPGLRLLSLPLAQPPSPSAHQAASFPTPLRLAPACLSAAA